MLRGRSRRAHSPYRCIECLGVLGLRASCRGVQRRSFECRILGIVCALSRYPLAYFPFVAVVTVLAVEFACYTGVYFFACGLEYGDVGFGGAAVRACGLLIHYDGGVG